MILLGWTEMAPVYLVRDFRIPEGESFAKSNLPFPLICTYGKQADRDHSLILACPGVGTYVLFISVSPDGAEIR